MGFTVSMALSLPSEKVMLSPGHGSDPGVDEVAAWRTVTPPAMVPLPPLQPVKVVEVSPVQMTDWIPAVVGTARYRAVENPVVDPTSMVDWGRLAPDEPE